MNSFFTRTLTGNVRACTSACGTIVAHDAGETAGPAIAGTSTIDLHADADVRHVLLDDVGDDFHFVERGDVGHRIALLDPLADFGVLGGDVAGEAGDDRVLGELILEPIDGGLLHGDLGAGLGDLFLARAGDGQLVGRLRFEIGLLGFDAAETASSSSSSEMARFVS